MNTKKYTTLISILATMLFVSSTAFSALGLLPITQNTYSQSKAGGLSVNKMVVGNLDSPQTLARLNTDGWIGLGLPITGSTNPNSPLDVRGIVRLSEIKLPNVKICSNQNGDIVDCGFVEFFYGQDCFDSCTTPHTFHKFMIPPNVTEIEVELWGAGGMGYFAGSDSSSNKSPDNSSNCIQTGFYQCPDGGSTYMYDKDVDGKTSATILAQAYGGRASASTTAGGSGGSTNVPNNSKVSNITQSTGSAGGAGGAGGAASNYVLTCESVNYNVMKGGTGGSGGAGGSGGSGGASVVGPKGGLPGVAPECENPDIAGSGVAFKGLYGYDGIRGSGGSGASGHGGSSYESLYSEDCHNSNCISAQNGHAGGGGGGYVKAKIAVTPGDIYTFKISHGGQVFTPVPSTSGLLCDFQVKSTCFQDTYSGKGGDGFVRVYY